MGIDQLGFQSVQLGYLKILQMGNVDPNNTKAEKEYELELSLKQSKSLTQKLKRAEELSGLTCENVRATLLLRVPSPTLTQEIELVPIERATQDDLNATSLGPNNGENRRQFIGEGFE
ncbi:hypothetical protein F511_24951 [Dorcoceras hygrometricum]|uniref:Uncharacterized protein n=1 Tax=Dorcoceras hygrometricum TaxID=472368 RepID=A0A2Z7CBQ7_9LAMI|nr:hypothetical protein F511_24951 [Dorcoceras hygrometricum]